MSDGTATGAASRTRLLAALDKATARLQAADRARFEPIAVVGIGCRVPGGAEDPEGFWRLLAADHDAIAEVPPQRWPIDELYAPQRARGKLYTRRGGFLGAVDRFDSAFFGISPREASSLDPQQRLLLEVAWEALEHAGIVPAQIRGSAGGVFIGATTHEYADVLRRALGREGLDAYFGSGNTLNACAGRLAYVLGLRGPALALDTACSSSLVAVHLACQSLRTGECRIALAGGVNLMLTPEPSIALCQAGMLAPDGRCKGFSAHADGYGRGEGCGVVVLKGLSDALADGDTVLATIRGSAVNQDGASAGLTVPNGPAQSALIRAALAAARLRPEQVDYLEAHGTGTALGDPIEVAAAAAALGEGRAAHDPLLIGSVKSNIGHLEAAAGVVGLIKVVLALDHERIPAHLHARERNPAIAWSQLPLRVVDQACDWPRRSHPRRAGVSSFGASGTNAHVLVEEAPPQPLLEPAGEAERPLHVLAISARDDTALTALAARYAARIDAAAGELADICYSAATTRTHFAHRIARVVGDRAQARQALRDLEPRAAAGAPGAVAAQRSGGLAFMFTGQGAQWVGMGRLLYHTQPTFRATLERCEEILGAGLPCPLLEVMHPASGADPRLDETRFAQPALFALEYALAELWRSWGVEPDLVIGHSVGEFVAACVAGVLDLDDALALVAERGRLMQALPAGGAMVAVGAQEGQARQALEGLDDRVAIAAVNAPDSCVVSGDADAVEMVLARLAPEQPRTTRLAVSHAFHSPAMTPMLGAFEQAVGKARLARPRKVLVSNVTGEVATDAFADPRYWVQHVTATVRFADGVRAAAERGCTTLVEIGPRPTLSALAARCVPGGCTTLPSLRPDQEWQTLLASVAALYEHGVDIDWAGFDRDYSRRRVAVPTYPFQRQRYWPDPPVARSEHEDSALVAVPDVDTAHVGDMVAVLDERRRRADGARDDDHLSRLVWREEARPRVERRDLPGPSAIVDALRSRHVQHERSTDLGPYWQALAAMERLAADYARAAFATLGWNPRPGEHVASESLSRILAVAPEHARLLERLLTILCEAGALVRTRGEYEVADWPALGDPGAAVRELRTAHPQAEVELALFGRCGDALAQVLRGERDPLELLFPQSGATSAATLYHDSPAARAMNATVAAAVEAALSGIPAGRVARVLEIGAGTGGTSEHVFASLAPESTEYLYTDISPAFLGAARERFAAHGFIRYGLLDIERDPDDQGFRGQSFDLVLAANVLHATADLRRSLGHVRQLLAPDGLMVLLEGTAPLRFLDLTFGLTPGWWRFCDHDVRPAHPLLAADTWCTLLMQSGFASADALAGEHTETGLLGRQAVVIGRASEADARAHWLVFEDAGGIARNALQRMRPARCTLVSVGDTFEPGEGGCLRIDAEDPEHHRQLLDSIAPVDAVLHAWSLDAPGVDALDADLGSPDVPADAVGAALARPCRSVLGLVQALARDARGALPRLWLVTRGAVAATTTDPVPGLAQAPMWGMTRSIALEHPGLRCTRIDLDPHHSAADQGRTLADELRRDATCGEDQIAIRGPARLFARLARGGPGPVTALPIDPDASYVVTGGTRGIGWLTARWLVQRGARRVALIGRSRDGGHDHLIAELEALGARVRILTADVSDRAALAAALASVRAELGPVRGVVHAAGVLDDGVIAHQSWARFVRVWAPKVAGAWHLHTLTDGDPLDFFVLFSSMASLLGSPGQSNHAAANAFLDALAAHRVARGRPALSINWGPWAEVGAAASDAIRRRVRLLGLEPMTPQQGLCVLDALLGCVGQAAAAVVSWTTLAGQLGADARGSLLAEMVPAPPNDARSTGSAMPAPDIRAVLIGAAAQVEREALLLDWLREQVRRILGLAPDTVLAPAQTLGEIGFDSLVSTELKNRLVEALDVDLPMQDLLGGATVAEVASLVLERLILAQVHGRGAPRGRAEDVEELTI